MEICNLVETLFVICVFFVCQDVLSLRLNYPPKIGADENVCFLEWTSSARCESGTQPAYEGRLFRFDGKKVQCVFVKWDFVCYINNWWKWQPTLPMTSQNYMCTATWRSYVVIGTCRLPKGNSYSCIWGSLKLEYKL